MKGLLIKDFELTITNLRLIVTVFLISFILLFANYGGDYTFIVAYLSIVFAMMTLNTITYDRYDGSIAFLFTLPCSRKCYVYEKYIFTVILLGIGACISTGIASLLMVYSGLSYDWMEWWVSCAVIAAILLMLMSVMIPLQLKFGTDNGRVVIIGFVALVIAIGFILQYIAKKNGSDITIWINYIMEWLSNASLSVLIIGGIGITGLAVAISIICSERIIDKMEF